MPLFPSRYPTMPTNKRRRPDIDIYHSSEPLHAQHAPEIIHRHTTVEPNANTDRGATQVRSYFTVPNVQPAKQAIPLLDSLLHDMNHHNYSVDDGETGGDTDDNDDDEDTDECPYNWMDPNFVHGRIDENEVHSKRKRTAATVCPVYNNICFGFKFVQDTPLLLFIPEIDAYLKELIRLEACHAPRTGGTLHCSRCGASGVILYTCSDCFEVHTMCSVCIVSAHGASPFHRIKVCFLF